MVLKTTAPKAQKEALWRKRLADQAASGMSITQWCRQSGISDSLFHYWKSAIAKRDGRQMKPSRPWSAMRRVPSATPCQAKTLVPPRRQAVAKNETKIQEAAFARVAIASSTPKPRLAAFAAEPPIEIVVSGPRLVRVGAGFDAPTLSRVLAVLEDRPC